MTIRGLVMGAILLVTGFTASALRTLEAAFWAAIVALIAWALVRFFHARNTLRRSASEA